MLQKHLLILCRIPTIEFILIFLHKASRMPYTFLPTFDLFVFSYRFTFLVCMSTGRCTKKQKGRKGVRHLNRRVQSFQILILILALTVSPFLVSKRIWTRPQRLIILIFEIPHPEILTSIRQEHLALQPLITIIPI